MAIETDESIEGVDPQTTLASVPSFGGRAIDPYEDMDFVVEGTEEAQAVEQEPAELAGRTKEEIFGQLKTLQAQLDEAKQANDPVKALGSSLQEVLKKQQAQFSPPYQPQYQPQTPVETPEQRRNRLNALWLEDPVKASEEMAREQMRPIVDMMLSNQTALSKDLALSDPGQKTVYDRWSEEVEREVNGMNPIEKAQNPRVYQTAISRVRARHTDDVVQDLVQQAVEQKLKELGIDTKSVAPGVSKPAVYSPAGVQRTSQTGPAPRKTVVIPKWVVTEADRQGLDPKFYYQHLKENGRIK